MIRRTEIGDCRPEILEGKTDPKSQIVNLQSEIKGKILNLRSKNKPG
jgi:hypothetical protein